MFNLSSCAIISMLTSCYVLFNINAFKVAEDIVILVFNKSLGS